MENENKKEDNKSSSLIESANNAADRLEKANQETEKLLQRIQEIETFKALGGKSEGKAQEEKPVEVDPRDYAKLALAGKFNKF